MTHERDFLKLEDFQVRLPRLTIRAAFEVGSGERCVLTGPSGGGKTTIFRFLAGFPVDGLESGRLLLGGEDLTGTAPESRGFGVLFQEAVVFPALSVVENAAFGLKARGVRQEERRARVLPWLEKCGLVASADGPAAALSGGEKQRLALVRALCWQPRALLLDEPFSALDPALRAEMGRWLVELHAAHPVPLILVTHDPEEAARIGTRSLAMASEGGVHFWGTEKGSIIGSDL